MPHNPYTPPASQVQDVPASTEADADGDADVTKACMLIWGVYTLSLINGLKIFIRLATQSFPLFVFTVISTAIGLAIVLLIAHWMTTKLKAGRNWMRVLLVVLTVASLAFRLLYWKTHFTQVIELYGSDKLLLVISVVQLAVWLTAMGLLFTARSRRWFAAMKRA